MSAFLVLLQAMAKSDTGINAGLIISCLDQYLTDAQSSFHLCHSDQLTVPPVKVINASISQLYDDQVRLTSTYFSLFCSSRYYLNDLEMKTDLRILS